MLSSAYVYWEVELAAVIDVAAAESRRRARSSRWPATASARTSPTAAFSSPTGRRSSRLGKSIDTFGPIGPALVSLDALSDPNDLALACDVGGERMQDARTSDMIFGVPALVAFLASMCTLTPGDLIFTGTPSGVGST